MSDLLKQLKDAAEKAAPWQWRRERCQAILRLIRAYEVQREALAYIQTTQVPEDEWTEELQICWEASEKALTQADRILSGEEK